MKLLLFVLSTFFAAATLVSLIVGGFQFDLYGSPEFVYRQYGWVRDNIFGAIYWALLSWTWFPDLRLPHWAEDAASLYLLIGLSLWRGDTVVDPIISLPFGKKRRVEIANDPEVLAIRRSARERDIENWEQFKQYGPIRRSWIMLRLRMGPPFEMVILWPLYLFRMAQTLRVNSGTQPTLMRQHQVQNLIRLYVAFVISLIGVGAFTYGFFYWNHLASLVRLGPP